MFIYIYIYIEREREREREREERRGNDLGQFKGMLCYSSNELRGMRKQKLITHDSQCLGCDSNLVPSKYILSMLV
jgi:hypothetical protein